MNHVFYGLDKERKYLINMYNTFANLYTITQSWGENVGGFSMTDLIFLISLVPAV